MTRQQYFEQAENEIGRTDIEAVYRHCYNAALENKDTENLEWFKSHIMGAINQRWINQYVKPTGMLSR
jgi:hypothetical protein